MPWTQRRDRPGRGPRSRRRRITGPGAVLGVVTLAVSGTGWGLLLADVPAGDVGPTMALGFGAFAGAGLVAAVWAFATRPGGITARYEAMSRLRRTDAIGTRGHVLGWPPRALWQLPLLQVLLLALTVPVAYHLEPGDHTIWGVLAFYGLLVAYAGLLAATLVWTMVVVPLFVLGRILWFAVRGRPIPEGDRMMLVLALILLPILLFATGIVLGAEDGTNDLAALFGAGDQSSPWLWVARASVAVVVATVLGAHRYYSRVARARAAASPAAPARTD